MQKLRIILSCTARKRSSDTVYPRLRAVRRGSPACVANEWRDLIKCLPRPYIAGDLYGGEYWQSGMDLIRSAGVAGGSVISAGLGLVDVTDRVPMYEATLAAGHPDSVVALASATAPKVLRREWWLALTDANILGLDSRKRLADLAETATDSGVVVAVGRDYLDAVASDLQVLLERVADPKRVMVFAAGAPLSELEASWVRVPGSLRLALGGSLASTSVRAAAAAVADVGSGLTVETARAVVAELADGSGSLPVFDRERHSDEAVEEWLFEHLTQFPEATKTTALRSFRDEGNACEQKRFGRIFAETKEMVG